jgi:membrane protein
MSGERQGSGARGRPARGSGAGSGGGIAGLLRRIVAFALQLRLVRAYLRYSDHRGPALADSVTYRALFSVFAGVLLGFSIAALWLGGDPEAMRALEETVNRVVPGLSDVVDPSRIEAPAGFSIVGALSLVGLVGAAISAIGSLRTALRVLGDELHDDGFFLWVLLRNLLVAVAFGGLLGIAAALTVASTLGVTAVASWIGLPAGGPVVDGLGRALGILIVLAVDTVAVALVFRALSGIAAPARALWGGALLGGIGLVVLQELSGLFVRGATANPLLASFAALIALLLWFNLSAQVILIASSSTSTATAEAHDRVRERYGAQTFAQLRRRRAEDLVAAATRELRAAQEAERRESGRGEGDGPER